MVGPLLWNGWSETGCAHEGAACTYRANLRAVEITKQEPLRERSPEARGGISQTPTGRYPASVTGHASAFPPQQEEEKISPDPGIAQPMGGRHSPVNAKSLQPRPTAQWAGAPSIRSSRGTHTPGCGFSPQWGRVWGHPIYASLSVSLSKVNKNISFGEEKTGREGKNKEKPVHFHVPVSSGGLFVNSPLLCFRDFPAVRQAPRPQPWFFSAVPEEAHFVGERSVCLSQDRLSKVLTAFHCKIGTKMLFPRETEYPEKIFLKVRARPPWPLEAQ